MFGGVIFWLTGCSLAAGEASNKKVADTWHYKPSEGCNGGKSGECGPNEWHTIAGFETCSQKGTQSPIDMAIGDAVPMDEQGFELHTKGTCEVPVKFMVNEHTVEVEYVGTSCDADFHVTWNGHKYALQQFHYHSPSENKWNGGHFAMEAHYVHKCVDCDRPEFVVLAAMIGVGDGGAESFLHEVLEKSPQPDEKSGENVHEQGEKFTLPPYDFFPASVTDKQYYFEGSMTTPPCNPGPTHWVMATDPVYVKQETIDRYRKLINSDPNNQLATYGTIMGLASDASPDWNAQANEGVWDGSLGSNNRPVQPLTGPDNPTRKLFVVGSTSNFGTAVVGVVIVLAVVAAGIIYRMKKKGGSEARETVASTRAPLLSGA